jgi:hypothetical protein
MRDYQGYIDLEGTDGEFRDLVVQTLEESEFIETEQSFNIIKLFEV